MQEVDTEVKNYLEAGFDKVKATQNGFKFNKESLKGNDLDYLDGIPANVEITIKRSGTGLVVIIE